MAQFDVNSTSVENIISSIKAGEIAREIGVNKTRINRLLYNAPFIRELCCRDDDYNWHGLIRQTRPHYGLPDFCGYYDTVAGFLKLSEEEWMKELQEGCKRIGRNLNNTRGLFHSFRDAREVMTDLFRDLELPGMSFWEICFELRIKRAKWIRIYADVLVITELSLSGIPAQASLRFTPFCRNCRLRIKP